MNKKSIILSVLISFSFFMAVSAQQKTVKLKVVETSDVHGMFFPTDYITGKNVFGSMARVSSYVKKQREVYGDRLILLDNGDILQGQPTNYYWNFIDTISQNISASVVNYMKYDAQTIGNHDLETGHACYDKWIKELHCPLIAANMLNEDTAEPYTQAYTIIERDGARIAILGMVTPAIPSWLSNDLWSGMMFDEMKGSARYWVERIKKEEKPDVIIGLFHSGLQGGIETPGYIENSVLSIAEQVGGFDLILFGHDHIAKSEDVKCAEGGSCLILNPSSYARRVGEADITLTFDGGKLISKNISGRLVSMDPMSIDQDYMEFFKADIERLKSFTSQQIGVFDNAIYTRQCFFGSSAFSDLVHNLQLSITKADISINAPLHLDAVINKGVVTMADMFNLYKYDNKLYVVKMKGSEVRKHLEMSYSLWTNQMTSADDHILLISENANNSGRLGFINQYFNFDSAAGIDYEVDVTKPEGEKVKILKMSNGQPFDEEKWYNVAMNSYRANGGGELITRGAGIPKEEIESRIVFRSDLDQRYYLIQEIKRLGHINAKPNNNWRFVPEQWTKPALERDMKLLFHL